MMAIYYNATYPRMGLLPGLKAFSAAILGEWVHSRGHPGRLAPGGGGESWRGLCFLGL